MDLTTPPPEKLSDLIELAIADARKLDRARYRPMWSTWHQPQPLGGKCMICLAGAVIAGTLGYAPETTVGIASEDTANPRWVTITHKKWRQALCALDWARVGNWESAYRALHGTDPDGKTHDTLAWLETPVESAFSNWEDLDTHLKSLNMRANQLRQAGL